MKRNTVAFLFFVYIFTVILFNSCSEVDKANTSVSVETQKKIDSLNIFYELAHSGSVTNEKKLESLTIFLKGAFENNLDSLQYKGYILQTRLLNKYGYTQKAIDQSYQLLNLASQNNDSIYMSKALYKLGLYNNRLDHFLNAFEFYNKTFKISRDIKDSIKAGKCLRAMANIHIHLGDYNAAKTTATDGLKYLKKSTQYIDICSLYHGISMSFSELGNHEDALFWNSKVLDLFKDSIAKKKIGINNLLISKNSRAAILAQQKNYEKSIEILQSLLKEESILKNSKQYARILNNLGDVKFLQNPDNSESEEMMLEALGIRRKEKDSIGLYSSNLHLSKYYKNKDIEKSKYYARQAYACTESFDDDEALLEILTLITQLEPDSLKDYQRYKKTSLKLMELRKKTREIYAPTRFENESLLKENELKNKKIELVRNQNTIYLLGILVSLMGIGFIIYFFKQRTKYMAQQNRIEKFQASYETETRISKRLHDEIGNDIFQLMLQYENDPHDPIIKEKLNTSYIKARDISRENNEFETGETFSEELYNMLQNYTQNGIQLMVRGFDTIDWTYDKSVKITLYRVLQELMTNMQKHSNATLVVFVFSNLDKILKIKYSDNGVGIAQDTLISKNGLRNTEKRIRAIGGTLIFDSENGKGFKAEIKIPNLKS